MKIQIEGLNESKTNPEKEFKGFLRSDIFDNEKI